MKWIWLITLVGVVASVSPCGLGGQESNERSLVYSSAPFQELILHPLRYKEQGIKTFGFILRSDEGYYYLVAQRDRAMIFDSLSRIALDGSQIKRGRLVPELSGHMVYVEGLFVVQGAESDPPGALSRKIVVTDVWSPEVNLEGGEEE